MCSIGMEGKSCRCRKTQTSWFIQQTRWPFPSFHWVPAFTEMATTLSKTFGHSHFPKKQPVSVENPARGYLTKCPKTYLGKYSQLCNQLPGDNEGYREKKEHFAGGWGGRRSPIQELLGRSHLELAWSPFFLL